MMNVTPFILLYILNSRNVLQYKFFNKINSSTKQVLQQNKFFNKINLKH